VSPSLIIRGIGLVTPLGNGAEATWDNLLAGKTIADHARVPGVITSHDLDRVTALAKAALSEAIASAGWSDAEIRSDRTALIVGTSKGAADTWLTTPPPDCSTSDNRAGRSTSPWGLHTIAQALACQFQLAGGARRTLSCACATGLNALIQGAMLIRHGDAERALIVAAESSLHPLFIRSYERLGVLAAAGELVRPFDINRSGFLVGEAAAAVCLENREPQAGEITIDGFAFGSDATHLTGTDASALSLRHCLARAITQGRLDLVHAHGTGTVMNDVIELAALEAIVPNGLPNVFSHKAGLGHTLGAAGLIAAALSVMMHRNGVVLPNANTSHPLNTQRVSIASGPVSRSIGNSVCIAAGFGGATAAVSLKTT